MGSQLFIGELLLVVAMATLGVAVFERLRLPTIAGFLVMGAVVGPGGLALVDDPERVRTLAELGVVFLLFGIGLELPIERLRLLWRRALAAGGLQVLLTTAATAALAVAFGLDGASAFVLGGIVAMSSTALVMGVLSSRGEMDAPQGQLVLGILLFQDLCIVPFLLIVPLLAGEAGSVTSALLALGQAIGALALFVAVSWFALPRLLDRVLASTSPELFTLTAFLVVVGSAWIAEEIGLTLAVGAFVGGLVLNRSPYAHQLFAEVLPLRGVLLGIFFTAVGMLLDPAVALEGWSAVGIYVVAVVVLKAAIVAGIVAFPLGLGARLGILAGLALAQTGEFSFVLAGVALESDLLSPVLHQVFVAGSIVTLVATPWLVAAAPALARRLAPDGGTALERLGEHAGRRDHVVLLGFGLAGQTLGRVLRARNIPYVAVDANASTVSSVTERGEPAIYGDVARRSMLEALGVRHARLVVVTVSDPLATLEAVRLARSVGPDVPIVARTRYVLHVDRLYQAGASEVVAEEYESTLEMVGKALGAFGIPDATIAQFTADLRLEGYEPLRQPALPLDPWLGEVLEEVATEWLEVPGPLDPSATLSGLDVRQTTGCNVLAVVHRGARVPNPPPGQSLHPGDRVLALGTPTEIDRLRVLLGGERRGPAD